ncbi:endonuclease III [Rothia sp. HMSC072B04]|uniref:endonuclease III n=1 Tax=Rothia sp. HMSC072B04 TaxID=1739432 RepID=UPI0008A56A98|nr:endonuclease III [Rothia sp. HMSC072B04]OFQ63203.1 endonuclease III [Rothia sp. HMSC072B04]
MTENATRTEVENTTAQNTAAENSAAENTESPLQIRFVPEFKAAAAARRLNARAPESHLATVRRARKINRILGETYPYAVAELDFDNPFELLIATVLSAQTTDVRVNSVTGALFARYPDAAALASARTEEVEPYIQSLGFYRAKARSIVTLSQQLVERHNGQVPSTLEELVELAGVGRKTANVVLGNAFDMPGLTVDTHFGRLARRMGFTTADAPETVEKDVAELIERKDWTLFSHRMVYHGRRICHAKKPACGVCPVADLCPSYGAGETNEQAARKLMKYEMAPGREDLHLRFLQGATRRELMAEGYPLSA